MARMVVIYKQPADASAFDAHYFGVHVPLAKQLPGLRRYEVSRGPIIEGDLPGRIRCVDCYWQCFQHAERILIAFERGFLTDGHVRYSLNSPLIN